VQYDGGTAYVNNLATQTAFARRDAVSPAENVKTAAKATARGTRYLAAIATEEDVITTSIQVPLASVNLLREGMRVSFRATHLPGYETPVYMRVLNRTVKQDSELTYSIKMELGSGGGSAGSGHGPTPIGPFFIKYWVTRVTQNGFGDASKTAHLWLSLGGPTDPHLAEEPNGGCTF
jgi:hypothetical protein